MKYGTGTLKTISQYLSEGKNTADISKIMNLPYFTVRNLVTRTKEMERQFEEWKR